MPQFATSPVTTGEESGRGVTIFPPPCLRGRCSRERAEGARLSTKVDELARAWLSSLAHERRVSPHTLRAYRDDVRRFLVFLGFHHGKTVTLTMLQGLRSAYMRGFLTARRNEGLGARGVQRAIAALR